MENTGRFKKGHKLGNRFKKGHIPWSKLNKGKYKLPRKSKNKRSAYYKEWTIKVKERDGYKCKRCGSIKGLSAHHIKPWKECEELRFDVDNGIALCSSCHGKEEGFQKGHVVKFSEETKKILSEKAKKRKYSQEEIERLRSLRKGLPGPNKGKKFSEEHKRKLSEAKKGKPSNILGKKTGKPAWNAGMKMSDEHKKKLSEAAKNRCRVQQTV